MKYKAIKINGFGKLIKKEIELKSGINIIYGENEAGKSTFLKFLTAMLYGLSKNKNGKNISDMEKYKPWKTDEFSGNLEYSLDNGQIFEVYREFKKKNPIVYNSQKEDISRTFKENKTKGLVFFEEQTGISEDLYYNTAIIEQENVKLAQNPQNVMIQKINNKVSSGDDNISYQKCMMQINKLQTENIGTSRTQNKPINIVNEEIEKLKNKKKELEYSRNNLNIEIEQYEGLVNKVKILENEHNLLNALKEFNDNSKLKYAEIEFNEKIVEENIQKVEKLENQLNVPNKKNIQKIFLILYILAGIIIALSIFEYFILTNKIFSILSLILGIVTLLFLVIKNNSNKKLKNQEEIINEINLLKKVINEKQEEINVKKDQINEEIDYEKEKIYHEYKNDVSIQYMERAFDFDSNALTENLKEMNDKIDKLEHQIHEIEFNQKNSNKVLEELPNIVEKLENLYEEKTELTKLNNSYNLAKESLEKAYEEVKKNISPQFINNLCTIISNISDNKYSNINISDSEGIVVQTDMGNYLPVERLSVGTIDQMYLALRLSSLKELSNENIPIIFDETFAYFDDQRLKNILNYLNTEYNNNQILILTCSNREMKTLEKLNIKYNLVEIKA